MLKYELKRIFTKRLNRVLITIGLALSVILSFLAATSNRFVSPQGHLETGISATRKVVADKNRNKGLMTPKRISELITQDQRAFREYKDKGESDKIYGTSIQQYLDVEQLVSYILTGNEDYNPSIYLDVNPKKLLNIYKIREAKIQKLIRQNGKTEEQRKYLKAQYDKISTPYQYEAPDSWDTMQLYVVTYSIVLAVLMGVLASGIFFRRNYTESRCDILFIQIRKRQSHKNKDQCRTHHINGNLLDRYVSVYCDITYLDGNKRITYFDEHVKQLYNL